MINHSALNIIYLTEAKKNILQPAAAARSLQNLNKKPARHPVPPFPENPQQPPSSRHTHTQDKFSQLFRDGKQMPEYNMLKI